VSPLLRGANGFPLTPHPQTATEKKKNRMRAFEDFIENIFNSCRLSCHGDNALKRKRPLFISSLLHFHTFA
jgi:hypothetical protein